MYVCMYVCVCVCMYVSMYVCMYVCLYVCMFVCMYVCIVHVYMCICILLGQVNPNTSTVRCCYVLYVAHVCMTHIAGV